MLKITRIDDNDRPTRLCLEGRLTRAEVAAFEDACAEVQRDRRDFVIDLAGVRFADRDGTVALRNRKADSATLTGASAFLEELLQELLEEEGI
jgi:anti-anti-sigma regulatory factor